ncbi:hypothetical protein KBC14_01095 [Candidatus Woesebacteria bacterium]|jgi:hypothetical protein|nr:hypothetical protein [Candidatus Woesebacteria bacterium]
MKKTLIFSLILIAFFSTTVNAQTPTIATPPINVGSSFGALGSTNVTGLTCGVPGGLGGTDKCCVVSKDTSESQAQVIESIPEYFCLPAAATGILDTIGGIISDTIIDPISNAVGLVTNLVTLDLKGAGGNIIKGVLPDKTVSGVSDALNGDKVCLSDAAVALSAVSLSMLPFNSEEYQNIDLPQATCIEGSHANNSDPASPSCACVFDVTAANVLCSRYYSNKPELAGDLTSCNSCANAGGYYTGIGCINASTPGIFIGSILSVGLGIAGGFAMLCIFYAAFILQTSRGNPERIKKAKENLQACITGMALIIFSVLIMRLIGVSILRIPGFN